MAVPFTCDSLLLAASGGCRISVALIKQTFSKRDNASFRIHFGLSLKTVIGPSPIFSGSFCEEKAENSEIPYRFHTDISNLVTAVFYFLSTLRKVIGTVVTVSSPPGSQAD